MTALRAGAGVLALVVVIVAPTLGADRFRRRRLPGARGALGALVTAIIAIGATTVAVQLLGAVGLFRIGPLLAVALLVGGALAVGAGAPSAGAAPRRPVARPAAALPRWSLLAALGAAGGVLAGWCAITLNTVRQGGTFDFDSVNYHLTFAARFVHDGWITRLMYVSLDPTHAFHPLNGELTQAVTMLTLGTDIAVGAINIAWLGLLLLSAWCLAARWSAGPLGLIAGAAIAAIPIIANTQPGAANTDIAALALLIAALALVVAAEGDPATLAVAGAAGGLAIATKLTVLTGVGLIGIAIVVAYRKRPAAFVAWWASLAVTGSFWYIRNLVRTGNPLPFLDVAGLPKPNFPLVDRYGPSDLLQYIDEPSVLRDVLRPSLPVLGLAPVAMLAIAAAAAIAAIVFGRGTIRLLGLFAATLAAAYAVTPMTGYGPHGNPFIFVVASNLRYLVPALLLALLAGAVTLAQRGRWEGVAATAGLLVVVMLAAGRRPGLVSGRVAVVAVGVAVGVVGGLAATSGDRRRRLPTPRALGAVALGGVVVMGAVIATRSDTYLQRWYVRHPDQNLAVTWHAVASGPAATVGIFGIVLEYPFAGPRADNEVDWILEPMPHGGVRAPRSCEEWRRRVNAINPTWIALSDEPTTELNFGLPEAVGWTETDPAAQLAERHGSIALYRLRGAMTPGSCPA